jgi:hypothetical protein
LKNILILFNPYYKSDVIEQHLKLLIKNEEVAFGKIRSHIKKMQHLFEDQLEKIYDEVSENNYLQLFLTDYSSIYVAKVIKVSSDDCSNIAPIYYKDLEVEKWFVITDLREIVRDDFESVREDILSNFTTPNYDNHSYALYGNNYVYPLIINMKNEIDYFETEENQFKYYKNIYKSKAYLDIKNNLKEYCFGEKWINKMHPNSLDNIVSAEMEYLENKNNPLYDYSTVVIKYAKTMEQELYVFMKELFKYLVSKDKYVEDIEYSVQSKAFKIKDIFNNKPNIGTYKFLLKDKKIQEAIERFIEDFRSKKFLSSTIPYYINMIQGIRNESVHGESAKLSEAEELRKNILGISKTSILIDVVRARTKIK